MIIQRTTNTNANHHLPAAAPRGRLPVLVQERVVQRLVVLFQLLLRARQRRLVLVVGGDAVVCLFCGGGFCVIGMREYDKQPICFVLCSSQSNGTSTNERTEGSST